jgi:DNA replication initiation complex subunit (GINS family)
MAINQNHTFEELNGIKCGIVEKNVSQERVDFLKQLLEYNGFEVVVAVAAPAKAAPAKPAPVNPASDPAATSETVAATPLPEETPTPPAPDLFTVGVTDVTFNAVNAIFGRLLKTKDGHIVTLKYWQQKEAVSHDDVPYYA